MGASVLNIPIWDWIAYGWCLLNTILIILLFVKLKSCDIETIKSCIEHSVRYGRLKDAIESLLADVKKQQRSIRDVVAGLESSLAETRVSEISSPQAVAEIRRGKSNETLSKPMKLYASTCSKGAFRTVSDCPNDKAIYIIYVDDVNADQGIVSIDTQAYDKVAQTQEYLKDACEVSGSGSKVKEVSSGTVAKEKNGQWVIKKRIVVELS
ncbi:MAG TPA: hypothetical protein DD383_00340 [Rikenellaceae bacterium]|nr:hypothetical protein [Rikenellaceae bacterium]